MPEVSRRCGSWLACGAGLHDTYLVRLDLKTMRLAKVVRFDSYLNSLTLSPDGSKLAVSIGGSDRERLHLHDAISPRELPSTVKEK